MRSAVLIFMAFAFAAGQPPAQKEPPPGTLRAIDVLGNQLYSATEIVKASGLKIGQPVSVAAIEQARLNLTATDLFANVEDEYRYSLSKPVTYDLTFKLTENQQLFPMRFEGLGVATDGLVAYLREHVAFYNDRIPGADSVLQRYSTAIREFVSQTKPGVKIKAGVSNDDPQHLAVVFTTDAPRPTISQVTVSGNEAVDTGAILRAVNQVAVGVPYSETVIDRLLNGAIKPLYAAKGYAAVSFPKVEAVPSETNLGVVVKVQIQDGPVFKFGAIRFRGTGLDEDEVRSNITFKPGAVFNGDKIEDFRLELTHRLRRRGYLEAVLTTETRPDDATKTVAVTYTVIPGAVYNFGSLDIHGLDVTSEPAVSKLWGEKPGHPFNPDYPDFFMKRIQEEGLFDNLADTSTDYTSDIASHTVTVHLYFKGGKSEKEKKREKEEEEERRRQGGDIPI
jgi:outer membrane protein assembly factor BamA